MSCCSAFERFGWFWFLFSFCAAIGSAPRRGAEQRSRQGPANLRLPLCSRLLSTQAQGWSQNGANWRGDASPTGV
jgi:hypothetical protein